MKYIGAVMIFVGVVIQWNERRKNKAHVWLTNAIQRHVEGLEKGRESTKNLPDSEEKVPGFDISFAQIKDIIVPAEEGAISMTQEQLREVIDSFERAEKKQEPVYVASYVLIAVGTILTVLEY